MGHKASRFLMVLDAFASHFISQRIENDQETVQEGTKAG